LLLQYEDFFHSRRHADLPRYTIEDLAANSTFEETTFLLWNDRLPTKAELEGFKGSFGLPWRWTVLISIC